MNNLLQSLSSQRLRLHVHQDDLKRLLSKVKDGRGHDAKLSDAFYDSLEGVLLDLRTVTIDNHDAEAFLKPVSKTDYPDYYEIIKEPMDLQTMLRKVKQKSYKSKAEFQDDLELIWSNCFVYNTGDGHPLRQCAVRLKTKAQRLLRNVTDRRERLDPPVPLPPPGPGSSLVTPGLGGSGGAGGGGVNGVMVNGHGHAHGHTRKHSSTTVVIKRRDRDRDRDTPTPSGFGSASASASRNMSLAPSAPASASASPTPPPLLPAPPHSAPSGSGIGSGSASKTVMGGRRGATSFGDQLAFVRTARGMGAWEALDRELGALDVDLGLQPHYHTQHQSRPGPRLPITDKLRQFLVDPSDSDVDDDYGNGLVGNGIGGNGMDQMVNGDLGVGIGVGIGEKRKLGYLNGVGDGGSRPRKKARLDRDRERERSRFPLSAGADCDRIDRMDGVDSVDGMDGVEGVNGVEGVEGVEPVELWWEASTSTGMMTNALPALTYPSSFALEPRRVLPPHLSSPQPSLLSSSRNLTSPSKARSKSNLKSKSKLRTKKKKRRPPEDSTQPQSKTLLGLINTNVRTLRRVRQVHDKFLALNLANSANAGAGGDDGGSGPSNPGSGGGGPSLGVGGGMGGGALQLGPSISGSGMGSVEPPDHLSLSVDEKHPLRDLRDGKERDKDWDPLAVDDRPWRSRGISNITGGGESESESGGGMGGGISGLELGEKDADDCLRWMGMKVLEHSGFQSTAKSALDVFTGVASEYLFNVGRTLRYLCDKYSKKMSTEEIILHTLFESGITHIRDLERYITEDVLRYGTRLTELEKKLTNAYNEVAIESALDDDAFFNEDEEEDGELVMGNFADAFGDDFLGLRELGIAEELGLQSLTIPKRLLRGKNKQRDAQKGAKPSEPPPPYPPPPSFAPLDSSTIDTQIPGLLRTFYINKINSYASRTHPHPPAPSQPTSSSQSSSSLPFIFPPAPAPSQLEIELAREMGTEPPVPQAPPPVRNLGAPMVVLPDDPLPPGKTKSGPLGQIVRPSTGAGAKKSKVKSGNAPGGGGGTGGGGGGEKKEGILGPAGPGPGKPPPPPPPGQQPPVHLLANAHFTVPLRPSNSPAPGTEQKFVVLPGSAGSHSSSGGGEGKKGGSASPKKKNEPGTTGLPSFVGVNA